MYQTEEETDYSQTQVVQATTLRTIKNLKKFQGSQSQLEDDDQLSEKNQTQTMIQEQTQTHQIHKAGSIETVKGSMRKLKLPKRPSLKQDSIPTTEKREKPSSIDDEAQLNVENRPKIYSSSMAVTPGPQRLSKPRIKSGARTRPTITLQKFNESTNQPIKKEYVQIDMNLALNLVLQKSKAVSQRIEQLQLSGTQVSRYLEQDAHYKIALHSLLAQLVSDGKLLSNLTNIPKSSFVKIEKQAIQWLEKKIRLETLNEDYVKRKNAITVKLDRHIAEIQLRIQNETLF